MHPILWIHASRRPTYFYVVAYERYSDLTGTFWYFGKRVTQESWSLMRGFNYSDLTGNFLVFWKTGHTGELVAYERF